MERVTATPEFVLAFRAQAPALTKSGLREVFGISETTWCKLRDGRPIKRKTLERIAQALERLQREAGAQAEDAEIRKAA